MEEQQNLKLEDVAILKMKNLNSIEYLVGGKDISKRSVLPYDNSICDFLGDLSNELNLNSESENYPDIKEINGIKYMNDGDWVHSMSALVERHDGSFGIVFY